MNYFLNMHSVIVFFITALFAFIIFGMIISIIFWITNKIPEKYAKVIFTVLGMIGLFSSFILVSKIKDPFYYGGIKELYVIDKENEPHICIWFIRVHSRKVGAVYDQRLKSYDMISGKPYKHIEMLHRYHDSEFRMFYTSGDKGWSYNRKTGLHFLDFYKPEIIADQQRILKENPQLGSSFKLYNSDYVYNPYENAVYIKGENGQLFYLNTSLKAVPVKEAAYVEPYKKNDFTYAKNWCLCDIEDNLGRHFRNKDTKLLKESVILLEPELIREINSKVTGKNKAWILHKSAIYGRFDPLISFVDEAGIELNRINLGEVFNNKKKIKVIGTYSFPDKIYVFIGAGETFRASVKGFTLKALVTDPKSGKILEEVKYF